MRETRCGNSYDSAAGMTRIITIGMCCAMAVFITLGAYAHLEQRLWEHEQNIEMNLHPLNSIRKSFKEPYAIDVSTSVYSYDADLVPAPWEAVIMVGGKLGPKRITLQDEDGCNIVLDQENFHEIIPPEMRGK